MDREDERVSTPFDQLRDLIDAGDVVGEEAGRLAGKCIRRLPAAERAEMHDRLDFALVGIELALAMNTDAAIQKRDAREVLDAIEAAAIKPV